MSASIATFDTLKFVHRLRDAGVDVTNPEARPFTGGISWIRSRVIPQGTFFDVGMMGDLV
ncbi:MAG: hypothetical protein HQL98_07225 [Magnetococcales bacterium]|nr:hypothetical protein [Magnetococcales bacterium]